MDNAETSLDDLLEAIEEVKHSVDNKTTTVSAIIWLALAMLVWSWFDSAWHSKVRYSAQYDIETSRITIENKPHDCDFFVAPMGMKFCHHERIIGTVHWARSTTGGPIVSYDDGKTWSTFTPEAHDRVPQNKTLEALHVGWEKKDD